MLGVDDVGCPPAQLEGDLLEVRLRRGFEEGASDGAGTGEGEHVDVGMQPHGGADVRAGSGEDMEDAVGHTGLLGQTREVQRAECGVLRGFDDHRIAGGQGRGDLPAEHGDRVVPRQDGADDADGDPAHPAPALGPLQVAAVVTGDEVGGEAQVGCHILHVFGDAVGEDLAGLDAVEVGDLLGVVDDEIGQSAQHLGAMGPVIGPGPLVEGGAGGGDGRVELALGRLPDGADELTVDR